MYLNGDYIEFKALDASKYRSTSFLLDKKYLPMANSIKGSQTVIYESDELHIFKGVKYKLTNTRKLEWLLFEVAEDKYTIYEDISRMSDVFELKFFHEIKAKRVADQSELRDIKIGSII